MDIAMHELSIANALIGLVSEHVPIGSRLQKVTVRIGAMQALVPEAMQNAWRVAARVVGFADAELIIECLPWSLTCRACGRAWTSHEPYEACSCSSTRSALRGSDEITLIAIDVTDNEPQHDANGRNSNHAGTTTSSRELIR